MLCEYWKRQVELVLKVRFWFRKGIGISLEMFLFIFGNKKKKKD